MWFLGCPLYLDILDDPFWATWKKSGLRSGVIGRAISYDFWKFYWSQKVRTYILIFSSILHNWIMISTFPRVEQHRFLWFSSGPNEMLTQFVPSKALRFVQAPPTTPFLFFFDISGPHFLNLVWHPKVHKLQTGNFKWNANLIFPGYRTRA